MATRAKREVGKEGVGSGGDVRDRFRDAYKPGAGPKTQEGFGNPIEQIKSLTRKRKRKKPAA